MTLERVGIVMLSTAGGAVWTLPVINAIRRAHPQARVTWVLQPGAATLVQQHPSVHEILLFDRSRGLRAYSDLRRTLTGRRFDVVLLLQSYLKAGLAASFMRAPRKLGPDRARSRDISWIFTTERLTGRPMGHMQDQFLEFLAPLGVSPDPVEWHLGPWVEERPWQQQFFAPFERPAAALVVGTTKAEKDWPAERWAELSDALWHDYGLEPVLVGGRSPRELEAERVIMSRARHAPRSALGSGLRKLVAILDGSALVITPDTGPLHMAVALDRPVISLFGYTNPKRTGPYRRFTDLVIDAYGDPGEDYPANSATRRGRMARITVRDVLEKVGLWRERYADSSPPNR